MSRKAPFPIVLDSVRAVLGKVSDAQVARDTGVPAHIVRKYREEHNIPAWRPPEPEGWRLKKDEDG